MTRGTARGQTSINKRRQYKKIENVKHSGKITINKLTRFRHALDNEILYMDLSRRIGGPLEQFNQPNKSQNTGSK